MGRSVERLNLYLAGTAYEFGNQRGLLMDAIAALSPHCGLLADACDPQGLKVGPPEVNAKEPLCFKSSPLAASVAARDLFVIRGRITIIPSIPARRKRIKLRHLYARRSAPRPVDDVVAQTLLEPLALDQIKITIAAVNKMTEVRQLEQQWSLRRERAR